MRPFPAPLPCRTGEQPLLWLLLLVGLAAVATGV